MKTKIMLKAPDELWLKFKSKAVLEGKDLNEKILELIEREVKK